MAGILAAGAAPAFAQGAEIKWRMASSFPRAWTRSMAPRSTGRARRRRGPAAGSRSRCSPSGEIVPGLQVFDAAQNGTVQAAFTAPYYFWGKDPAFALDTAVSLRLNARQIVAWQLFAAGWSFPRVHKGYGIYSMPSGNHRRADGSWFRKRSRAWRTMKGLKMRIGGFAGK